MLYCHFGLEHVGGHHKFLSTEGDPASALKGESLYYHIAKSFFGGFRNAWSREIKRVNSMVKPENKSCLIIFKTNLLKNKLVFLTSMQYLMAFMIYLIFGIKSLLCHFGISLLGIFFVEWINYINHYGLQRQKNQQGEFEKISENHSWNAYSTPLLFRIQRHSDHHMHSTRPY